MEIDAAVESVWLVVATHLVASVVAGRLRQKIPHRGGRCPKRRLKLPRWDREQSRDPVVPGDRLRPVTIEAIRRIQTLHLTGGAHRLCVGHSSPSPAGR
jgi:hypothetical protein